MYVCADTRNTFSPQSEQEDYQRMKEVLVQDSYDRIEDKYIRILEYQEISIDNTYGANRDIVSGLNL